MTGSNGQAGPGEVGGYNRQSEAAGPGAPQGSPPQPDWAEFSRSIESMGSTIGERLTQELGGRLDRLHQSVEDGKPQEVLPDPNAGFDFDGSTPRQLYDHMMSQFTNMMENTITGVLDQALGPYADQITGLRRDFVTDQGTREIRGLEQEFKDFREWVPEMKEIASRHPSLSIREVYVQAKFSNSTKAGELDRKYNPSVQPPRPFSLGPSSSSASSSPAAKSMSKQDAAVDAYRQVQERHPGVLAALDDAYPQL